MGQNSKPKNRNKEAKSYFELWYSLYPEVFNPNKPKILALQIDKEIRKAHSDLIVKSIKHALRLWTGRRTYLERFSRDTYRYHLDGSVAQEITVTDKEYAKTKLIEKHKRAMQKQQSSK
jgi:sRNA-binding protein